MRAGRPGPASRNYCTEIYIFNFIRTDPSLTLPGLARRSDKPSAAGPGGVPEGVGGRRPRIVKEHGPSNLRPAITILRLGIIIEDNQITINEY
eukprot:1179485-Prorocentrum_minimum.AAC.4